MFTKVSFLPALVVLALALLAFFGVMEPYYKLQAEMEAQFIASLTPERREKLVGFSTTITQAVRTCGGAIALPVYGETLRISPKSPQMRFSELNKFRRIATCHDTDWKEVLRYYCFDGPLPKNTREENALQDCRTIF